MNLFIMQSLIDENCVLHIEDRALMHYFSYRSCGKSVVNYILLFHRHKHANYENKHANYFMQRLFMLTRIDYDLSVFPCDTRNEQEK